MIIKDLFIKTTKVFSYNMVLVQPLLIFLLLIGLIIAPLSAGTVIIPAGIFMLISIIGLFCAFLAGWFSMFHKSIELSDKTTMTNEERAEFSLNLFKEFFPGVGKFFPKMIVGIIIYTILYFIILNIVGIIGEYFIGLPKSIPVKDFMDLFTNEAKAMALLNKLSHSDKIIIAKWNLLTLIFTGIFMYLTMFWVQALIIANKTPFAAYLESLKTIAKRPFTTFSIFLCSWGSLLLISILNSIMAKNIILQFIGLILFIFAVVYFTIMAFLYFEKFSENNCCSWTDSFR